MLGFLINFFFVKKKNKISEVIYVKYKQRNIYYQIIQYGVGKTIRHTTLKGPI